MKKVFSTTGTIVATLAIMAATPVVLVVLWLASDRSRTPSKATGR
jgi:hypothetical protein